MTNIEKLARLIVRTGHTDAILSALSLAIEVSGQADHVRGQRPELGVCEIPAGSDPAGTLKQAG